jgi:hypothetical protein
MKSEQAHETQDLFPEFDQPQRLPTSPLTCAQRTGSLSTPDLNERSPRSSLVSTIKSPQRRGQYKLSEVRHNLGDSRTTPSPSRGQVPKRNEHTEILDEVFCLKIEWVTQEDGSNVS